MTGALPSVEEAAQESLDAIEDRLLQMGSLLRDAQSGGLDPQTAVGLLRQHTHSIKGLGASVGAQIIKVIAHRFEDYLAAVERLEPAAIEDAQRFMDRISEALDGRLDAGPEDIARFCRRLPAKQAFDVADVEIRDIEVMLVMPEGAATSFVTRELVECGYRIINVRSTVDAIALVVQMRPDLVIASNVMAEITGVDFACALRAMPSTRNVPVALLTSEKRGDPKLEGLPDDVPILSKSARFADDVARVFSDLGIL